MIKARTDLGWGRYGAVHDDMMTTRPGRQTQRQCDSGSSDSHAACGPKEMSTSKRNCGGLVSTRPTRKWENVEKRNGLSGKKLIRLWTKTFHREQHNGAKKNNGGIYSVQGYQGCWSCTRDAPFRSVNNASQHTLAAEIALFQVLDSTVSFTLFLVSRVWIQDLQQHAILQLGLCFIANVSPFNVQLQDYADGWDLGSLVSKQNPIIKTLRLTCRFCPPCPVRASNCFKGFDDRLQFYVANVQGTYIGSACCEHNKGAYMYQR